MRLIEINNQSDWDVFQLDRYWTQFTQSWHWGEFRKSLGFQVRRFALADEDGRWLCAVQGEFRPKALGMGYWFAPRGPVFDVSVEKGSHRAVMSHLVRLMHEEAKLPRCFFWRFEPVITAEPQVRPLAPRFLRGISVNPSSTNILDLSPSEDELLRGMHEKTRYNIKVAAKHDVKVRLTSHPADIDSFLKLMAETEKRAGFVQHQPQYLYKTFQSLAAAKMARLRVAELNGAMLAADLEITYGRTVTYLYGASSNLMRQAMAPYLLHWEAIKAARSEGAKYYDFWGVNPPNVSSPLYKKSWEGISRFKAGWGGEQVDLIGTWDLPSNVTLYNLVFLRRILSGKG